jgi:hypothetical protein
MGKGGTTNTAVRPIQVSQGKSGHEDFLGDWHLELGIQAGVSPAIYAVVATASGCPPEQR